jgi:predicted transcriptional regulator
MSVDQLIKELKALPQDQRMLVVDAVLSEDDSWIPESFRQGMKDLEEGRVVDMKTALTQKPPGAA